MTRYSELYHAEVEAHDKTKRSLVVVRDERENLYRFIRESRLKNKFARWAFHQLTVAPLAINSEERRE